MGEYCLTVVKLEEISTFQRFIRAPRDKVKYLAREALRITANSLTPAEGWKGPVRQKIRDIQYGLFGYGGLPGTREYGGVPLYATPLANDEGWEFLKEKGISLGLGMDPTVVNIGEGEWVKIFSYYDGGSDGTEEWDDHNLRVNKHFEAWRENIKNFKEGERNFKVMPYEMKIALSELKKAFVEQANGADEEVYNIARNNFNKAFFGDDYESQDDLKKPVFADPQDEKDFNYWAYIYSEEEREKRLAAENKLSEELRAILNHKELEIEKTTIYLPWSDETVIKPMSAKMEEALNELIHANSLRENGDEETYNKAREKFNKVFSAEDYGFKKSLNDNTEDAKKFNYWLDNKSLAEHQELLEDFGHKLYGKAEEANFNVDLAKYKSFTVSEMELRPYFYPPEYGDDLEPVIELSKRAEHLGDFLKGDVYHMVEGIRIGSTFDIKDDVALFKSKSQAEQYVKHLNVLSHEYNKRTVYRHELPGGKTVNIDISKNIDIGKLSHIELSTELFGSWETPPSEREKGYQLIAFTEGNKHGQHLENFLTKNLSSDEILEISEGIAKFLGVELKDVGLTSLSFDQMNPIDYDWLETNKPIGYDWDQVKMQNITQANVHPTIEKYNYQGTNVLKNWFDEKDPKQLRECETFFSGLRIKELIDNPMEGKIDFAAVKATHAYIFQDVYPDWAGDERELAIGKKEPLLGGKSVEYASPGKHEDSIIPRAEKLFNELDKHNNFKGLDQSEFTEKLTDFMTELWQIHPFMEGNTRTTMVVCNRIATEAGHPMSLPFIDKVAKQMRESLVMATTGEKKSLEKILASSMTYELTHKNTYDYGDKGISLSAMAVAALAVVTLLFFGISIKNEAAAPIKKERVITSSTEMTIKNVEYR